MPRNMYAFPNEDVIIEIPDRIGTKDIFVEKKDLDLNLEQQRPFRRVVINFRVYYLENGNKVPVTEFHPRMRLWVGYTTYEDGFTLAYWDGTSAEPINYQPIVRRHGVFAGYAFAQLDKWPPDPNVGWV